MSDPRTSAPVLERSRLGDLTRIAGGGQGVTYNTPGVQLGFADAAVYKEYRADVLPHVNVRHLAAMPELLLHRSGAVSLRLVTICAWPCATVRDGAATVGFVMPRIPERFFVDMTTVRGVQRKAAEFQHLLNSPEYLAQRGIAITSGDRYRLVGALATALDFLHSLGIVVGDMSPKNMMFALRPDAAVYFIDADAMRVSGDSVARQVESPGWEVPSGEEAATQYSDRYKLGLMALRLLAGDQDLKDPRRLPPGTAPEIVGLITRSLSGDPASRPAPSEWAPKSVSAAAVADRTPPPGLAKVPSPAVVAQPVPSHPVRRNLPPTVPVPNGVPVRPSTPAPPVQWPGAPATFAGPPQLARPVRPDPVKVPMGGGTKAVGVIVAAVLVLAVVSAYVWDQKISTRSSGYTSPPETTAVVRTPTTMPAGTTQCSGSQAYTDQVDTCRLALKVALVLYKNELPKTYRNIIDNDTSKIYDFDCRYTSDRSTQVRCLSSESPYPVVYFP
ncbi:hypothetical protein TPB0596_09260 [Tsukamurella pulmonis]|uniref:hypothetical protein n=1 Tax=Tsukamurella pulmonis TaxID=47312 RepID=UPI001EE11BD1|nr:hypothetical protein [Tsukamurella pulmonis]BDD81163.1 hypothetical protein TPB0596_09260 [Tsukamurella pulmonis]